MFHLLHPYSDTLNFLYFELLPFKKFGFICFNETPLKIMKNAFFHLKRPLRYLHFCHDFFVYVRKRFDKKVKLNFKSYDVINWETNNYDTHIAQYLRK